MHKKSSRSHGSPLCTEVIDCLRECFEDLESGDPARIARWYADPYFDRQTLITQDKADELIEAIDKRLNKEVDQFFD